MIENFEKLIELFDYTLDSPRKKHIAGGVLLSISLLFGGLAFTTMTLKGESNGKLHQVDSDI